MAQALPLDVVAAVLPSHAAADAAVADLRVLGLSDAQIGVATPLPGHYRALEEEDLPPGTAGTMAKAAAVGAPLGSVAGLAIMEALVLGAGEVGLGGALVGLVGGGVWGAFFGGFGGLIAKLRTQEGTEHVCEIRLGGNDVLVVAHAGAQSAVAHEMLHRHGARCFLDDVERDEDAIFQPQSPA